MLFASGCRGSRATFDQYSGQTFRSSTLTLSELREHLPDYTSRLLGISGKAKVIINQPGNHERGTLLFDANRHQALIRYRNGLGIEGGRILIDRDSILIYNRIDRTARKMSQKNYSYLYLNGIMPMNPIRLMAPDLHDKPVAGIYDNASLYYVRFRDGTRAYIDRKSWHIRKIVYPFDRPESITNFLYQAYAGIAGFNLPRKIQMTSTNGQSSLYLLVQSLSVNPAHLDLDIELPGSIRIQQL